MSCTKLHKNDIGTSFTITIKDDDDVAIDISGATSLTVLFGKPNGSVSTQTPTFVTDGTDGQVRFISTSGFLDTLGTWSVQAYVQTSSGAWYSAIDTFKVERNVV